MLQLEQAESELMPDDFLLVGHYGLGALRKVYVRPMPEKKSA